MNGTIPGLACRNCCRAISADGQTLFTANGPSNDVSIIDLATRKVTKKIPAGDGPWGLALVQR